IVGCHFAKLTRMNARVEHDRRQWQMAHPEMPGNKSGCLRSSRNSQYLKVMARPSSEQSIVNEPSHFCNVLGQTDHLLGITKLIVVPNVEHDAFFVWMDNGGMAVINRAACISNDV